MKGVYLTSHVNDWLLDSHHPHILHVFDRVCNLINERREILSVVAPRIGNGPFNLVIDGEVPFSAYFTIDSPVSTYTGQLNIGDVTIKTAEAKFWNPHPDWESLHDRRDAILKQITSLCTFVRQPLLPYFLINSLSSALATANTSSILMITSQLAGLGAGLTPAGDDFIMGSLLATWIIHPREVARVLAEEIANTAGPLTTSLSAAWLRSAGKGEAGILWHEFFSALISADSARIPQAMNKILAIGETSGADALAGFLGTFACWAKLIDSEIH